MANEMRLKVAEAKQRDAGRGKARMNDVAMREMDITAGNIIEIKGKRNGCSGLASISGGRERGYHKDRWAD